MKINILFPSLTPIPLQRAQPSTRREGKKNPIPKAIPVIRAIAITAVGVTEELLALRLTEEDGIKPDLILLL